MEKDILCLAKQSFALPFLPHVPLTFIDGTGRYRSNINKSHPQLIAAPARLKSIVAAATIRIKVVGK